MRLRPAALSRTLRPPSGISLETHTTGCKGLIMFRTALIVPILSLICSPTPAAGQGSAGSSRPLTVVSAGPSGEVASLAEANEVRVVFSEPMVTLGRIPSPVRAPFFRIVAFGAGHVPLVGDDDPDLHARSEEAAAFCDAIRRHDRLQCGCSQRAPPGAAAHLQLHDAHGEAAPDALVSTRRSSGRADGHPAAIQPAGAAERRPVARDGRVRASRLGAAGAASLGRGAASPDGSAGAGRVQREGSRHSRDRRVERACLDPVDERLGQEEVPAGRLRCWPSKRRRLFLRRATCACGSTSECRRPPAAPCPLPISSSRSRSRRRSSSTGSAARLNAIPTGGIRSACGATSRSRSLRRP